MWTWREKEFFIEKFKSLKVNFLVEECKNHYLGWGIMDGVYLQLQPTDSVRSPPPPFNATTLDQLTDNEDGTTSFLKCVKCDLFELYYITAVGSGFIVCDNRYVKAQCGWVWYYIMASLLSTHSQGLDFKNPF